MSKNRETRSRREVLKSALLIGGSATVFGAASAADEPTPKQTEGPFYPDIDNDLTFVRSRDERASGDLLYVHGVVKTTDGKPVERALVEVWQTDHQGIYDHAGDRRHKEKDPNFQSFGRSITDSKGRYFFKTIRPRYYGAGTFVRTPHIHFKVWCRGYHELTTQMYFENEKERNKDDALFNRLSEKEQKLVTIAFQDVEKAPKKIRQKLAKVFDEKELPKAECGEFPLVLAEVQAQV